MRNSYSVKQCLLARPVLQCDMFNILISMRVGKFLYTADMENIYRMMWIKDEEQNIAAHGFA